MERPDRQHLATRRSRPCRVTDAPRDDILRDSPTYGWDSDEEVETVGALKSITRSRGTLIGVSGAALLTATLSNHANAAGVSGSTSLAGHRPAWAATATDLGALPSSQAVDFQVVLGMRNAAARQVVQAVSTPGSPAYRDYLTDAQFDAAFAPTAATEAAVAAWLRSAGLTIVSVASSRLYIDVVGASRKRSDCPGSRSTATAPRVRCSLRRRETIWYRQG